MAISVRRDRKAQGIGWSLLRHAAQIAHARGILRMQSIESRNNHEAIEVERDLGFTARPYPGDPTSSLWKPTLQEAQPAEHKRMHHQRRRRVIAGVAIAWR
ncbi:GNAT family N-acetyltransferase [Sphingobium sp.]|uniref:GNAT family N-acetyltransferase n=1 Tax=Sphingobium sp. TaxID=1912891 RepID=UPI000DB05B9B|nr:MAG: hypothetical protein DI540_18760 [Sphingobium sp.]